MQSAMGQVILADNNAIGNRYRPFIQPETNQVIFTSNNTVGNGSGHFKRQVMGTFIMDWAFNSQNIILITQIRREEAYLWYRCSGSVAVSGAIQQPTLSRCCYVYAQIMHFPLPLL